MAFVTSSLICKFYYNNFFVVITKHSQVEKNWEQVLGSIEMRSSQILFVCGFSMFCLTSRSSGFGFYKDKQVM